MEIPEQHRSVALVIWYGMNQTQIRHDGDIPDRRNVRVLYTGAATPARV